MLIAAPVYDHRDLAITCAEHHLHVLMEKPMARTILMIAFMKRFNRSMLHVAGLLEENAIGRVVGIRHNWDWGGNEQASFGSHWRGRVETWGGQWQDHGAHSVDLARWWQVP